MWTKACSAPSRFSNLLRRNKNSEGDRATFWPSHPSGLATSDPLYPRCRSMRSTAVSWCFLHNEKGLAVRPMGRSERENDCCIHTSTASWTQSSINQKHVPTMHMAAVSSRVEAEMSRCIFPRSQVHGLHGKHEANGSMGRGGRNDTTQERADLAVCNAAVCYLCQRGRKIRC